MSVDLIRFEDFELDARNYRLRRSGAGLKLERIPLELLLLLAGRAGELVTREEIIEKLWGKDIYLDTENAINTAVRKIRLVLGDDPAQPRFVQTVTGRGYRFIARLADQSVPVTEKGQPEGQAEPVVVTAAMPTRAEEPTPGTDLSGSQQNTFWGSSSVAINQNGNPDRALSTRLQKLVVLAVLTTAALCLAVLGFVSLRPAKMLQVSNYVQITNDGQAKQGPLVTDGLRVYFGEGTMNRRILAQVSASGGETSVVSNPLETPNLMNISPSRSELLVGSDNLFASSKPGSPLWVIPLPTGGVHRIGEVVADAATWCPDGSKIVFASGRDLYQARSEGGEVRKLASLPGSASWLRWSPDETRLRFTVTDTTTGFSSIWEVSTDEDIPHPVFSGSNRPQSECCGNWTIDGKYFLFQSTHEGKTEIWAVSEKGGLFGKGPGQPVQLTSGQMNSLAPVASSDGKKLYLIGKQSRGELARFDSQSSQFVPYLSGISAEFVDFSRDGKWITYVSFPEHTLWRSKVDGSERLQLTLPPVQPTVPRWSPDGKRIAFFDAAPGKPWKIYLVSAEGGVPEPVLNEQRNEMDPNWSPDGSSLLFSYFPIFDKVPPESLGLFVVDLRTRMVRKLPGSNGLWAPRWSLDGRYIVARSLDSQSLMLFDFETQAWTELTSGAYFGFTNWSGDGRSVYYLRRGREPAIFRIQITDRKVEEVASLKDVRQTGFRDGIWTGLGPENSPLVLRDIGTQELYSLDLRAP